jgi:hypothetical protein
VPSLNLLEITVADRSALHARVLKTYREADVQTTRQELVAWSAMPRIFIVLAGVGRLDLMPAFVKAGVSDTWIPFDKQLIRQILSEPTTQDAFLENQLAVLNSSLSETEHQHFLDGHVHLEEIKGLGSGGFGSVSHVFDPQSGRNLAKKSIPRVRVVQNSRARDAVFVFERELAVLRRVSAVNHRHLVKIAGSYTDEHDFVILFTPVADMNLADYLENSASIPELQSWFGCLSTALLRLHDMKVRCVLFPNIAFMSL